MSLEQAQRNLNQIEKDIVSLEKRFADLIKKEANKAKEFMIFKEASINTHLQPFFSQKKTDAKLFK